MSWTVERIVCSGQECQRDVRVVQSREQAVDLVLAELPWEGNLRSWDHYVWENGQQCWEDEATAALTGDEQGIAIESNGQHITYRLCQSLAE